MPWWEAACLYQLQRLPTPSVAEAHCSLSLWPAAYIATHTIPLEIGNALPERLVHLLYESQLGREDS